jgi:hypothetical protein
MRRHTELNGAPLPGATAPWNGINTVPPQNFNPRDLIDAFERLGTACRYGDADM